MNGIFSLLKSGTIASETGVSIPPKMAATFSLKMSSRAATTPLGGLDSSSRCTSSSMRPPSTPPLALISSMATASPRVIASPDWAAAPESAAMCPILRDSAASVELAARMSARPAASVNAHAAPAWRHVNETVRMSSLLCSFALIAGHPTRPAFGQPPSPFRGGISTRDPRVGTGRLASIGVNLIALPRIDDDRKVLHRRFDQLLGSMAGGSIEEQRVARFHRVAHLRMAVAELAGEHIQKLDAGMAKIGVGHRAGAERDQVGLDADFAGQRMAEEIVHVAGLGAAPLDAHAGTGLDEGAVAPLFGFGKEPADRHVERRGERVQRRERRRDRAVLDLRQHAGGEVGRERQLGHRQVERLAQAPHLGPDAGFEAARRLARRERSGAKIVVALVSVATTGELGRARRLPAHKAHLRRADRALAAGLYFPVRKKMCLRIDSGVKRCEG